MYFLQKIKIDLAKKINKSIDKNLVKAKDFVYPPQPEMGDITLACFNLSKALKKMPNKIAKELSKKIENSTAIGPYLNFKLTDKKFIYKILYEIAQLKKNYGKQKKKNIKKIMIEYCNQNTHKSLHIGHLRNMFLGNSLSKILESQGDKIIKVSYINDFGIHTAQTLWAFNKFYANAKIPKNKGWFLGQIYTTAVKKIKQSQQAKQEIDKIMRKLEEKSGKEYMLWQKTRKWSIEQFNKIYKELNIKLDKTFYESEFIDQGKKIIEQMLRKKILKKSQNAIIADLRKYKLGILVIMRADGTSLYPVADIPLAIYKTKKYKLDENIYIVDIRQSLYFRQLFKLLKLLGLKSKPKHLSYEFVKLPQGMMSSRFGKVITYEEIKEKILKHSIKETEKRHTNWTNKKIEKTALDITIAAMKFDILKQSAKTVITFDLKKALKFEGFTAPYLQYTYARINSILKKFHSFNSKLSQIDFDAMNFQEKQLVLKISKYPEIIKDSAENYEPSIIAKYLFELSQTFNDYYHTTPVLRTEKKLTIMRVQLLKAIAQTLKNGLNLLGIKTINEM